MVRETEGTTPNPSQGDRRKMTAISVNLLVIAVLIALLNAGLKYLAYVAITSQRVCDNGRRMRGLFLRLGRGVDYAGGMSRHPWQPGMGLYRHRPPVAQTAPTRLNPFVHTPCQARFMVFLAGLWVEGGAGN